jgi:hypothetical protein
MRIHLLAVTTFCLIVAAATYTSLNSWNGVIYIYVGDAREPAAVQKRLDVSNLKGSDLRIASRDRLLEEARLVTQDGLTGIELGHFVTKAADGSKQFACQAYQRIRLVYQAEGMAESGEVPEMTVEGPCLTADDINRIAPLWVPEAKIRAQRPHDFAVDYEENDAQMSFHFRNMGSHWPELWSLKAVSMFDPDQPADSLEFAPPEVHAIHPQQLNLHWRTADAHAPPPPGPLEK